MENRNDTPRISVVVPVYNTAAWLPRCMDSILSQDFRDFELLCIDDHSTDGSSGILDSYAASDSRFRIIHLPENHGVWYARNLALELSFGEWLYFMDSDDWIDQGYLSAMFETAVKTGQDVVINCNWVKEWENESEKRVFWQYDFIKEEDAFYDPKEVQKNFFPVVWTRLYRKRHLVDNHIYSPDLPGGVEDNFFTSLAEILQERSYIFHGPYYHYFQREGSLVRQADTEFNHFLNFRVFHDELRSRGMPQGCARLFFVLPKQVVDTQKKFDFLRSYFSDVRDEVASNLDLYTPEDVFFMEAILSCRDYGEWKRRFAPYQKLNFLRRLRSNGTWPKCEEIISGEWKI